VDQHSKIICATVGYSIKMFIQNNPYSLASVVGQKETITARRRGTPTRAVKKVFTPVYTTKGAHGAAFII